LFDQGISNTQPSLGQLRPKVGSPSRTSQQHLSSRRASVTTPISPTYQPSTTQRAPNQHINHSPPWLPHPHPSPPRKEAPPPTPRAQPAPNSPTAQFRASPSTAANPASSQHGGAQPSTQPAETKQAVDQACSSYLTVRLATAHARARRARRQAPQSTHCRPRTRGA